MFESDTTWASVLAQGPPRRGSFPASQQPKSGRTGDIPPQSLGQLLAFDGFAWQTNPGGGGILATSILTGEARSPLVCNPHPLPSM
jgi:hypothetical protein